MCNNLQSLKGAHTVGGDASDKLDAYAVKCTYVYHVNVKLNMICNYNHALLLVHAMTVQDSLGTSNVRSNLLEMW